MRMWLPPRVLLALIFVLPTISQAADIYIAQNASGANTGTDCTNAHSVVWFNTATNWGSGTGTIGPGDTAHLCGTFTTALNVQASGVAGSPVIIRFENGGKIILPYCSSGCLNLANFDYVTVDGGANGVIENTLNGTPGGACSAGSCSSPSHQSYGVYGGTSNDIEIKNLTVRNVYVHTGNTLDNSAAAETSYAIYIASAHNNIKIHDNVVPEAHTGVAVWGDVGTNGKWEVYKNTISENVWGIDIAGNYSNGEVDGVSVHDNIIHDNDHWWQSDDNWHTDPIFIRAPGSSYYRNIYIYNNYVYGAIGNNTGLIYLTEQSNGPTYIFNNVFRWNSTSPTAGCAPYGYVTSGGLTSNVYIYHNVFDGRTACGIGSGTDFAYYANPNMPSVDFRNNIALNVKALDIESASASLISNHSVLYGLSGSVFKLASSYFSLTQWMQSGRDSNSTSADPMLNSDYTLQSGSSAHDLGQNLTSICVGQPVPGLGALCQDKNGVARPSSGSWDAGAYQFSSQTVAVDPPTGLSATVN
jgi:hypothetical protein